MRVRRAERARAIEHPSIWAHVLVAIAAGEPGRAADAAAALTALTALAPTMADPDVVAHAPASRKWGPTVESPFRAPEVVNG